MVVGAIGQHTVNVTRPVVEAGNTGTAPAPTLPLQGTERNVKANLSKARSVTETHAQVRRIKLPVVKYFTNTFHVVVRLFSNKIRTKQWHKRRQPRTSLMFLPHFDVFCDLVLDRHGTTWQDFLCLILKLKTKCQQLHVYFYPTIARKQ